MKEVWKNLKKWQKAGILLGFLGVVAIIIVAVFFIINSEPKVKISFDVQINIPETELRKTREKMVGVIRTNTENFNSNTTYYGVARDYEEVFENDITTATFIVDFDEIKESYYVAISWPFLDGDYPNIIISCPLFDSKYPDTPCITESNSSSDIVSYLPYEGVLNTGGSYKINPKFNSDGFYLEIDTDGDANLAVVAAKEWLASLGFNPDEYLFFVFVDEYIQANNSNTNDPNVNAKLPYFVPNGFNVYPVTDENGNVKSIKAVLSGCTSYQTDLAQEQIQDYLQSNNINYPVDFEYCVD